MSTRGDPAHAHTTHASLSIMTSTSRRHAANPPLLPTSSTSTSPSRPGTTTCAALLEPSAKQGDGMRGLLAVVPFSPPPWTGPRCTAAGRDSAWLNVASALMLRRACIRP